MSVPQMGDTTAVVVGGRLIGYRIVMPDGSVQFQPAVASYDMVTATPPAMPLGAPPPVDLTGVEPDILPPDLQAQREEMVAQQTKMPPPIDLSMHPTSPDQIATPDYTDIMQQPLTPGPSPAQQAYGAPDPMGAWNSDFLGPFGEPDADPTYANGMTYEDMRNQQAMYASAPDDGSYTSLPHTQGDNLPAIPGASGGSSSGGGGGGDSLAAKARQSIMGNLYGMKVFGGTGSATGYPSSSSSGSSKPPKPEDPPTAFDPREQGWAKQQGYKNENLYDMIYERPDLVAEDASGLNREGWGYDALTSLPVGNLAMVQGASQKGWRGAPWQTADAQKWTEANTNEYGYLEDPRLEQWKKKHTNESGYLDKEVPKKLGTPALPDKFKTNPSHYANTVGDMYDKLANTAFEFNREKLMDDLNDPETGSQMNQLFDDGTKDDPANRGDQMGYYAQYANSIAAATLDPQLADAYVDYSGGLLDQWGEQALRKNAPPVNKYMRNRL